MSKTTVQKIDNIILKLTDSHSRQFVIKFVNYSLENIHSIFYEDKFENNENIQKLQKLVVSLSDADLHFLFFALLNIDVIMKDELCEYEQNQNLHKLIRFFQDLEKLFVQFFTDSNKTTYWLVTECKHLYLLA